MYLKQKTAVIAAASALAASFAMAPATMAQTAPQKAPAMSPKSASGTLDSHTMKSFVVAYLQVDKIKHQYSPKIAKAGSKAEKQKIETEASHKMVAAVNGVDDMNVKKYNGILTSAQKNPKVAKQLSDAIKKTAKTGQ